MKKGITKIISFPRMTHLFVLMLTGYDSKSQYLVSSTLIESKNVSQVTAMLFPFGAGAGVNYAVQTYKIIYNTVDAFNNPTIASGACMVPKKTPCDSIPLLSYAHGMVLGKNEVPSQIGGQYGNLEGYCFAAKGFLVSLPDYIGLGSSPGFHPFQHSKSEATASIDLMRAVREFVSSLDTTKLNGQVFITGYSQGGHAAMATLKYIQDNNLSSEFNIIAGATGSGAYSMSRVQTRFMSGSGNYNAFIPYVINSYQNIYNNLYTNISTYYISPFDVNIPSYFNGNSTFMALNSILPTSVSGFMQPTMLSGFLPDTITFSSSLRQDLKANDNYSWKPLMPLKLCYCKGDDAINYGNSIMAYDTMIAKGATNVSIMDVNSVANHTFCAIYALPAIRDWFIGYKRNCINNTLPGFQELLPEKKDFYAWPNPAQNFLKAASNSIISNIEMTNIFGNTVFSQSQLSGSEIDINTTNFASGIYFLRINDAIQPIKIILIR